MKDFILELGKVFIFIGEEYKVPVGNSDFYIDLLFYHRGLQCLVAFELKADKFKPAHLGQLNFYLEALDSDVKKQNENPSIGVLLCCCSETLKHSTIPFSHGKPCKNSFPCCEKNSPRTGGKPSTIGNEFHSGGTFFI